MRKYGHSPKTLGWGDHGRQELRFRILAEGALRQPLCSVLDVGCGFADLYSYLTEHGWHGRYTGVDIVPDLLEVARRQHSHLKLIEADIVDKTTSLDSHDFVIASGAFNARLGAGDNRAHIRESLTRMRELADSAVCVDFLSSYVDYQKTAAWHTDPAWALDVGKQLSRRVALRHDYMPFEFALFIYCDDTSSETNVFRGCEEPP